jgi:hypothetical protein
LKYGSCTYESHGTTHSTPQDDGNFEIHIHTNPSSDDGPVLPPKGDLDRWRNVKWWSDDFTKK